MTEQEAIINLIILMNSDRRVQVHTYSEVDGVWEHLNKKCPMCCAIYVLELSTDRGLQYY